MQIFLIGYMGSGKSTWGKKIAGHLDLEFVDLDEFIEAESGASISELFDQKGEEAFRSMERDCLHRIFELDNVLVSTGGGTPCYFDNMKEMNRQGLTVYLSMPPGALVDRLRNAKSERPLLSEVPDDELLDYVMNHLDRRESCYSQARLVIEPIKSNWKEAAMKIQLMEDQTR